MKVEDLVSMEYICRVQICNFFFQILICLTLQVWQARKPRKLIKRRQLELKQLLKKTPANFPKCPRCLLHDQSCLHLFWGVS